MNHIRALSGHIPALEIAQRNTVIAPPTVGVASPPMAPLASPAQVPVSDSRDARGLTELVLHPECSGLWVWRANHTAYWEPVSGGVQQVIKLCCALDGDGWPWALFECLTTGRWFQVLGTRDACVLETGTGHRAARAVARAHETGALIPMLGESSYWVPASHTSELFLADTAAQIGIAHLRGNELPPGHVLRPVRTGCLGSRN